MPAEGWKRVNKSSPCPVCGKPDACKVSTDGNICLCKRVEQGCFKTTNGGWYMHDLGNNGNNGNREQQREDVAEQARAANTAAHKARKTFPTAEVAITAAGRTVDDGTMVATWGYADAAGKEIMRVARFDTGPGRKQFRPVWLDGIKGWRIGDPPGLLPLYALNEITDSGEGTVVVVEGEKCADAVMAAGLVATTSAHGAESAPRTDWSPLAGRDVVLIPDSDKPGGKYAREVCGILLRLDPPARVRRLDLPGLKPDSGDDVVDWLSAQDTQEPEADLRAMVDAAPVVERSSILGGPVLTRMSDVEAKAINWLWPGRIPMGRIALLVGMPGVGKSFLTTDIASRVSTGTPWPDGTPCPKGSVILISAEDDPGDTLRPRLDAHKADVAQVHLLWAVRKIDAETGGLVDLMFTLENIPALEAALAQVPDCLLVIIDPIGSFMGGKTDSHRDNEVRAVLAPVAKLAERFGPAVLMVAHRRKASGTIADDLALGSRAFTGIARVSWHLTRDKADRRRRLLLAGKNNLAPEGDGLAFEIGADPAQILWERDAVTMSADDQLAEDSRPGPEPEAREAAEAWLAGVLRNGPLVVGSIDDPEDGSLRRLAKDADIAWRTIRRASDKLGIRKERDQFSKKFVWRLPVKEQRSGEQTSDDPQLIDTQEFEDQNPY